MTIGGIQSAMIGFSLFDTWEASMKKLNHAHTPPGSALVAAAFQAFEGYIESAEATHASMISGAAYMLNASGDGAQLITKQQMAPLLALNVMA